VIELEEAGLGAAALSGVQEGALAVVALEDGAPDPGRDVSPGGADRVGSSGFGGRILDQRCNAEAAGASIGWDERIGIAAGGEDPRVSGATKSAGGATSLWRARSFRNIAGTVGLGKSRAMRCSMARLDFRVAQQVVHVL